MLVLVRRGSGRQAEAMPVVVAALEAVAHLSRTVHARNRVH